MLTHVSGRISITPPLSHADLCARPRLGPETAAAGLRSVWVETEDKTLSRGLIRRRGVAVVAAAQARCPEDLVNGLQEIVDAFPGRIFGGWLECVSEDGERWRLKVGGTGRALAVRALVVWPPDE